mmetsp:Transcript_131748/g.185878  ORF Transcript_131748/g.185878 Transcript_131748/m.185878 type:complete len:136 (-) Transcript_131748:17-424(-)
MTLHDAVPWQPKFTRRTVSFQLQEETPVLLGSTSLVSLQPPRHSGKNKQGGGNRWSLPRPKEVPAFFIPKTPEDKVQIAAEAAAISLLAMVPKVSTGKPTRPADKGTLHRFAVAMPAERSESRPRRGDGKSLQSP